MFANLLTDGPMPDEYLELILCRDVYHCTPVALAEVPYDIVRDHLTVLSAEGRALELKRKRK